MKIKVGDKVKFLNDTGSGKVSRIIDQKTALVQVEDGFEVPWLLNDLVVDAGIYDPNEDEIIQEKKPELKSFSESVEHKSDPSPLENEELLLAFLPDKKSSEFETYLINSSSYQFKYVISRQKEGEMVLFHEGILEPGIKIDLGTYLPGNLKQEEYFRIQGIFFNYGFYVHIPPLDLLLKIVAAELFDARSRVENDYFLEKAVLHSLYDWRKPKGPPEMAIDVELLKQAMFTKRDLKPEKQKVPGSNLKEIDLHIEALVDNHASMNNSEILEIQLSRFRTALESAIIHQDGNIVFIHGVGNGKLKHEIRRLIDTEYKSLRYQDASFKEYGFGATMVIIK